MGEAKRRRELGLPPQHDKSISAPKYQLRLQYCKHIPEELPNAEFAELDRRFKNKEFFVENLAVMIEDTMIEIPCLMCPDCHKIFAKDPEKLTMHLGGKIIEARTMPEN